MAELNIADDANSWPAIEASITNLASGYGKIIDEVLHDRGAEEIRNRIDQLLPTSGRRWKGKPPQAKGSKWQHYTNESLAVTVGTTARYHYLYFPDDGSNTRAHVGNKQMFLRGAEAASPDVVEILETALVEAFEKG